MQFEIVKASRYFKVIPYTPNATRMCRNFQSRYVHRVFSLDEETTPPKLFATAMKDESEFRFHRNTLARFMVFVTESLFKEEDYKVTTKPLPEVEKRDIRVKPEWTIRDYQEPIIKYLTAQEPVNKFIGIQTGKGKATALKELVKIPGGWKQMGDIELGDDVIAKDGSTTKVTGVFPQGKVQLYRVTFEDDRFVDCCAEHLWKVYSKESASDRQGAVLDTAAVERILRAGESAFIDLCKPEETEDSPLEFDPYSYGLLLSEMDEQKESVMFVFKDEYLLASTEQRTKLLKGILKSSATVHRDEKGSFVHLCSRTLELALVVQYLVRSLGGRAKLVENFSGGLNEEAVYELEIVHPHPFQLFDSGERKKETSAEGFSRFSGKLRVKSVVPSGIEEAQCISIDHPDRLYVTTDFIVTHNTFCSLYGVAELGYRTIVIVEGGLVSKWASDILKVLDIKAKRTLCVRGGSQLRGLIGMADKKEFENIDLILLSNTTLQDWITTHETLVTGITDKSDIGYGIAPEEFYEKLKIGHRLIDEVHKKFHFNYKQDLYTNTHLVTSLSATLFSYDKVLESFYEVAYPTAERFQGGAIDKYASSVAVLWNLQRNRKVKTKEHGRSSYSHTAFENSIMKHREMLHNYFEMIAETLEIGYIKNFKEGNKAAVYVATTAMATKLTEFLNKRFPERECKRYVGSLNDPYANLLDPPIRVTTLGSGGTGHDILGLTDTILTVAIMSLQANIQVFGRLRFIPDQDTRFYYFTCCDVEQHMKYHDLKIKLMNDRAKSFDVVRYYTEI